MSRIRTVSLSAIVLAFAAATPAAAQQFARSAPRAAVVTQEEIAGVLARGDGHAQSGDFAAARRAYREARDIQVRVRELPETALWQIAQAYNAEGSTERAAEALDELATLAAASGEPNVQARALLEAAFLYRRAGRSERPQAIVRELRTLARSEALDPALRAQIAERVGQ
jgi:tetratricopeptide (TPR) repeat protein